jgi:FtsZ-binding cell division protein ZapB
MERELTLDETVALLKDRNAKAREVITALTAEVAELREENKKLLDQLVAAGFRNDRLEA